MKKCLGFVLALLLLVPTLAIAIDFDNVKYGGQIRFRGYTMDNFFDFDDNGGYDDEWDMFRMKASVWTSVDVGDNITGYVQLTDQNYGEGVAKDWADDNTTNKVFIDNAYIDAKNVLGPVGLKIGRQNLIYGSGFVILDGQSQFASTSIYFDGVKASWDITEAVSLDVFYMKDQENDRSEGADDDITLSGSYLTAKCPYIGGKQELYALNREDQNSSKDIWMFGIRMSDKFAFGLDYSGEVAMQTGTAYNNEDQDALGCKLDLGYTHNAMALKPRIFGQFAFMSGDEEDTNDYEGWDVYYGGWPQFGDLLAWKYVNTGGIYAKAGPNAIWNPGSSVSGEANYSNLQIMTAGLSCVIDDKVFPMVSYSKLKFDETGGVYGLTDDDLGNYYQLSVKYAYTKALSFSAYYAVIQPGDAFDGDDDAMEFFWEAELKF